MLPKLLHKIFCFIKWNKEVFNYIRHRVLKICARTILFLNVVDGLNVKYQDSSWFIQVTTVKYLVVRSLCVVGLYCDKTNFFDVTNAVYIFFDCQEEVIPSHSASYRDSELEQATTVSFRIFSNPSFIIILWSDTIFSYGIRTHFEIKGAVTDAKGGSLYLHLKALSGLTPCASHALDTVVL